MLLTCSWSCASARLLVACAGLLLGVSQGLGAGAAEAAAGVGPTVKEVVEFTRIVQPQAGDQDQLQAQISPDGHRLFIVTRGADVDSDTNLFDILLVDVSAARLTTKEEAAPTRLLSVKARRDYSYAVPSIREARWVDSRTIAFLGSLRDDPFQVYTLNVITRRVTQLTFSSLPIASFDVSGDFGRVAYVAQVPNPPMAAGQRSVVVGNQSFWSVKFGQNDMRAQDRRYRYFVGAGGSRRPAHALGDPFSGGASIPSVSISPDGLWVLAPKYEAERQGVWSERYPIVADLTARGGRTLAVDPANYFSRPVGYVPRRMVAYRSADGSAQDVLDAPDDAMGHEAARADRLWMGTGESVVLAGVHLPMQPGVELDRRSHIVEYWPGSGRWSVVAALSKRASGAHRLAGGHDAFVVVDGDRRRQFTRGEGGWNEAPSPAEPAKVRDTVRLRGTGWSISVEEGLNRPADLVARDADGTSVPLTRLNPQFSADRWGSMRPYRWKDGKGRQWDGGLLLPAGFKPGVRYALVIQTYGFHGDRFYLDGPEYGFSSGFAGRAFLRENMLVLAMPWRPSSDAPVTMREGVVTFSDGVAGAIESMVEDGLVDRDQVGILGWSATGERVLNLVVFSDAPIRSASLLDGDANTLFSFTVTHAAHPSMFSRKEAINEGPAFGESLGRWVQNDPAMHTDCIRAALRIETYGPAVLNNWDIYALLRRQYKAAEMIVIPEGAHSLSRPSERVISLQGNVDWHRFWLKGEERQEVFIPGESESTLKAQYVRWRQMAELKRVDDAKPRCVRSGATR